MLASVHYKNITRLTEYVPEQQKATWQQKANAK